MRLQTVLIWLGPLLALRPETARAQLPGYDAWAPAFDDEFVSGPEFYPDFWYGDIDRSGIGPGPTDCADGIAHAPIDGVAELHNHHAPFHTVELAEPLLPGTRYRVSFEVAILNGDGTELANTFRYYVVLDPSATLDDETEYAYFRYAVTQTHWREGGQWLVKESDGTSRRWWSDYQPLQYAVTPIDTVRYLTFSMHGRYFLPGSGRAEVPTLARRLQEELRVRSVTVCPCARGPSLVAELAVPRTEHNLRTLRAAGLTLDPREANGATCGGVPPARPPDPQPTRVPARAAPRTVPPARDPPDSAATAASPAAATPAAATTAAATTAVRAAAGAGPTPPQRGGLPAADSLRLNRPLRPVGERLALPAGPATLTLYDHKRVDGDIVTVLIDDAVLVDSLRLTGERSAFAFELPVGETTIVLHAENLRRYVPNTAAFVLAAGGERHEVILSSDLDESAYFTVEGRP